MDDLTHTLTTNRLTASRWLTRKQAKEAANRASDGLPQDGMKFTIMEYGSRFYVLCAGEMLAGWLREDEAR